MKNSVYQELRDRTTWAWSAAGDELRGRRGLLRFGKAALAAVSELAGRVGIDGTNHRQVAALLRETGQPPQPQFHETRELARTTRQRRSRMDALKF